MCNLLWCLGTSHFNTIEYACLNFGMWFFAEKKNEVPYLKRVITGDEKWVFFSNVTRKRSLSKPNEFLPVTSKGGAASQNSNALCMVGQQRYYLLWIFATKLDNKFRKILIQNGSFESRNQRKVPRNDPLSIYCLSAWQCPVPFWWMSSNDLLTIAGMICVTPPYSPDLTPSDFSLQVT